MKYIPNPPIIFKENINDQILGNIAGCLCDCNIPNTNGILIPKEAFENTLEYEKDDMLKSPIYGVFGSVNPHEDSFDACNICIQINRVWFIDDIYYCGGKLLNTALGRIIKIFIDEGLEFAFSYSGTGLINNNIVDSDSFVLDAINIVSCLMIEDDF